MVVNGIGYNDEWLLSFTDAAILADSEELKLDYKNSAERLIIATDLLANIQLHKEAVKTDRAAKKAAKQN